MYPVSRLFCSRPGVEDKCSLDKIRRKESEGSIFQLADMHTVVRDRERMTMKREEDTLDTMEEEVEGMRMSQLIHSFFLFVDNQNTIHLSLD